MQSRMFSIGRWDGWGPDARGILAVAVVVGMATITTPISGALAQTLNDILIQSYQNNPDLRASRARLRATDEGVPQALSGWRPTVSLQGDYGWDRTEQDTGARTSSGDAEYTQPRSGSLVIDQNIYRGGRTVAATRRAENTVKAERARLSASEQTVLLDAVTAYMDVVRDEAIIDLNKNNVKVLTRQLEATQDRFRVGEVTRTDVAQSESRVVASGARTVAERLRGRRIQLAVSRATYAEVVGSARRRRACTAAPPLPSLPDVVKTQTDATRHRACEAEPASMSSSASFIEERPRANDAVRVACRRTCCRASISADRWQLTKREDQHGGRLLRERIRCGHGPVSPSRIYQAGGVSSTPRSARPRSFAVQRRDPGRAGAPRGRRN